MLLRRHTLFYFILLCLVILPFSAHAQSEPDCDPSLDFDAYTDLGEEAFSAGDLEAALTAVQCAVAADSERSLGYYNLGFILGQMGHADEALENYTEAIRLDPENRDALMNRGQIYSDREQYADAIADYSAAIEIEPTADLYNSRGILNFRSENYTNAEADFSEAVNLNANEALYIRNRAAARYQLQRYNEAYEDFLSASQLAPDWDVPAFGVADALYSAERYDEALAAYRDAISRFGTTDARNTRLRRISVIRSGAIADASEPLPSGAITADSVDSLFPLARLERESTGKIVEEAVSPNGLLFASADSDGIVSLWDSENELLTELDIQGSIKNLIASPDSTQLALVADDSRIVLISVGSQSITAEWAASDTPASLKGIVFSPDGALIAGIWEDSIIRVYDAVSGLLVGTFTQPEAGIAADSGITISPNGRYLAVGVDESSVQLWDVLDGTLVTTWSGAEEALHTLTFNPQGNRLYGASDEALYYWNSDGNTPVVTRIETDAPITDIRFSPDELLVAVAAGNLGFFDATTMEPVAELTGEDAVLAAVFSTDGNSLIASHGTITGNGVFVLEPFTATVSVDVEDYAQITADNASSLELITEVPLNEPRGVIWSADGDTLFVGSETGVFIFPLDGESVRFSEQPHGTFAVRDGSPIFQAVVTGEAGEQTLIAYDVEDFDEPLLNYTVDDFAIRSFVYGDDLIALATHSEDGRIISEIVRLPPDADEPEVITRGGTELMTGIAVRSDGLSAVAPREVGSETGPASIELYHADGTHSGSINAPVPFLDLAGNVQYSFVEHITFSPDNRLMAVAAPPTVIRVWQEVEPGQWEAIDNLEPPEGGGRTVFSPSGEYLLCGGDEEVVIWRIEDEVGRARFTEVGRITATVGIGQGSIAFNTAESLIAIITSEGTIQVWGIDE